MTRHLLGLLLAATAASECCDPLHGGYEVAQANVALCTARRGVPITAAIEDNGHHVFVVLKSCQFPQGEK